MGALIDTSAIYALLDPGDAGHEDAVLIADRLGDRLVTHAMVLTESISLVDRRLPAHTLRRFLNDLVPRLDVIMVDERLFSRALAAFRAGERRRLSFVDSVTIEFCRDRGIQEVFAFDDDFERAGLTLLRA